MKILIINGANLNNLGKRDKNIYGGKTLNEINESLAIVGKSLNAELEFFQSNAEGEIIDKLQQSSCNAVIINAGAYSHYSLAIMDALNDRADLVKIEVHLSNIYKREEYRQHSVLSAAVDGVIAGFGELSYKLAINAAVAKFAEKQK